MEGDLQIPTKEVRVVVCLVDGSMHSGTLFLAEQHRHLSEFLLRSDAFMPLRKDDGSIDIVNRDSFLWVSIPLVDGQLPVEENVDDSELLYDERAWVGLTLRDGSELKGEILYSPPTGERRLTDFLNRVGGFVPLWTSEHLYVVRSEYILRLREDASSTDADTDKDPK